MKTKILITGVALIVSCSLAFSQDKSKSAEKQSSSTKMEMAKDSVYYTCSMHPEVVMDKPGNCPKCGMTLVEKTGIKKGEMHNMHNMHNMQDSTKMKCDTTKMKKCC